MSGTRLQVSRRIRATPYQPRVEALGVSDYSVVNHTILPKGFGRSQQDDYWHLREAVQLWDVGCQRQVELRGPDAAALAQLMTPRDLRGATQGQCLYAPLTDESAGMINDPVILKLAEDHYWLSIADSDVLLWAKGLVAGLGWSVQVDEPDVWPLAVQGPRADDVMAEVFGEAVRALPFFRFRHLDFAGQPLLIARSGYSKQGGFEIYLHVPALALQLWDTLWEAGRRFDIRAGCPNLIERIEGGLLSYGNEMTRANNPLECGMERYCTFDGSLQYLGRDALSRVRRSGAVQQVRGLLFGSRPCPPVAHCWQIEVDGRSAGTVTSAIWSPRFKANVALGMVGREFWTPGQRVSVRIENESVDDGTVVGLPFPEPDSLPAAI